MDNYHTFKDKRKCLFCETPIADQVHASRKYCLRIELPDGTIKSCKDDYHSPIRKKRYEPYKSIAEFHKDAHKKIENLFKAKGETVTLEEINQSGINLFRSVELEVDSLQRPTFRFVEFEFQPQQNKQYKINKHGKVF